ncbi:MAG: beta galactosidase jelly roll domain-containing protein [Acidobacteriales bacterium]|nr:beta galactosidase jelly roll domain-containing protein [Terriglobales bacterium]
MPNFSTDGWHRTAVPTTVVAALVADGTYPDPYFGMNLKSLPGMDYSSKSFFANQSMPADSPFRCSWWFRTEFPTPAASLGKNTWLHFDGINYRANVWLNGAKIANEKDVAGMMRLFTFPVKERLAASGANVLAVEVFAPGSHDLAMTWVDWNPTPPDKNLGLWKDVYLTSAGDVSLQHPFVSSRLENDYRAASLTITAELRNSTPRPATSNVSVEIEGTRIEQELELGPSETKTVAFTPERFPQLKLAHPRLWWPYQMGEPEMYSAHMQVETGGQVSDETTINFGIREVTSELTASGHRLYKVNGRKVLIRGAAWAPDMLLRWSPKRATAAFDYVRDMGLNAVRLEGRMERDEFFDMADRVGVLIMPGWTCCDFWEQWRKWTPETTAIATGSLTDQLVRLRNHPSVFVWLYGSDNPPPPKIEDAYLQVIKQTNWPNPSLSSASETPTKITGRSGVKMSGPYDYVPPNYWLADKQAGGAFGFNTETSPGPVIPTLPSLKRFLPADHLWPVDGYWNYHAGGERFTTIGKFVNALNRRYGKPTSLEDFLRKSQAMNYEAQRAMFEAYGRNKYESTGVIQWMLNNAWPSIIWNLYDYYLVPSGAYFGSKKACEMLHVQYSYDDNSVAVVNGFDHSFAGLKVKATIYDIDAHERASQDATLAVAADSSVRALQLKPVDGISTTYFLKLELQDADGKLLSENFYWLSTTPDVLDWAKKLDTVYTPQRAYADLSALSDLAPASLTVRNTVSGYGQERLLHAYVENHSSTIAFMVHLRVAKGANDDDVVPIFWSDNYVSLLPGEKRQLSAHFNVDAGEGALLLTTDGWNVPASRQPINLEDNN